MKKKISKNFMKNKKVGMNLVSFSMPGNDNKRSKILTWSLNMALAKGV